MIHTRPLIVTPEDAIRELRERDRFGWPDHFSKTVKAARDVRAFFGPYYWDTLEPFNTTDITSVTLSTTDKALYAVKDFPVLGSGFFNRGIGKPKLFIEMFGRITTGTTPGNLTWDPYFGSGADATGTIIQASAAEALTASQTNLSWYAQYTVFARTIGTASSSPTGTLFGFGWAIFNESVKAVRQFIPASAPAASAAVDLTSANIISMQVKRSGSTGETMQIHDLNVTVKN